MYNNYFPYSYQSYQYQPQQTQQMSSTPMSGQQSSIIWVQGEAGAKSYLIAPNTTVQLWDSEAQVIYLKSADASGMPSMKIIDYTIRDMQQPQPRPTQSYVTKDEFDDYKQEIQKMIGGLSHESTVSTTKQQQGKYGKPNPTV